MKNMNGLPPDWLRREDVDDEGGVALADESWDGTDPDQLTEEEVRRNPRKVENFPNNFPKPPEFTLSFVRVESMRGGAQRKFKENLRRSEDMAGHSEKRLEGTNAEFFGILDEAVLSIAADYHDRYRKAANENEDMSHTDLIRMILTDVCVAVYKRMRVLGYTHYDLIQ